MKKEEIQIEPVNNQVVEIIRYGYCFQFRRNLLNNLLS
jgi:hypothetical protein